MRDQDPERQRSVAALVGMLAVMLVLSLSLGWGTSKAFAQNATDEEEDVPLDTKLFRQLMKDLGLKRNGASIDYRERAPLVVPPTRNLPPPQAEPEVMANPAWPKDPDVQQRKADAARKKSGPARTAAETMDLDGRPLSRTELEKGRIAAGTKVDSPSPTPEESGRAMKPSELNSKSFFSDMFSAVGPAKPESAEFTGEPVRESLTAPPTGYQTPSPNAPYGFDPRSDKEKNKAKAMTLEDRAVGSGGANR